MEKVSKEIFIALRRAIRFLAENDKDKATKKNRKGFSKKHTKIGHHLANKEKWTGKDVQIAFDLVRYYRRQIPANFKKIIWGRRVVLSKEKKKRK